MMAGFLSDPRGGRGDFLPRQRGAEEELAERYGDRRPHRTFLAREGGGNTPDTITATSRAATSPRSFLQAPEPAPLDGPAHDSNTKPRIMVEKPLLSNFAALASSATSSLQPSSKNAIDGDTTATTTTPAAYTTTVHHTHTMNGNIAKAVPPHLKGYNAALPPHGEDAVAAIRDRLAKIGVNVSAPKPATRSSSTNPRKHNERHVSKKNRWPSKDESPKPNPQAHNTDSTCPPKQEDAGSTADGHQVIEEAGANDGGAPLRGFDGKFAPAPIGSEWQDRSAFRSGQSTRQIEDWLKTVTSGPEVSLADFETTDGVTYIFGSSDGTMPDNPNTVHEQMGDLVLPREWKDEKIEGQFPSDFWINHIRSQCPEPDEGIDLTVAKPWWEMIVRGSSFLPMPNHPPSNGVRPGQEDEEQRLRRESDYGSSQATNHRMRFEQAKQATRLEKRRKKEDTWRKLQITPLQQASEAEGRFQPKTDYKLLIRPAQEQHMRDARDIYNWYVDNSCVVPELARCTTEDMLQRLEDIRARNLPFLVACEPGGPIKSRRKNYRRRRDDDDEPYIKPDRIVGIAYADDYNCMSSIYRFTAEVEVYVRYDSLRQGIGKCLWDKLMAMLDPGYLERGNYPVSEDLLNVSPQRVIKNIIVNLPYDDLSKTDWVPAWLENWLEFEQQADMQGLGNKFGKPVNVAIFKRMTRAELNHAAPPIAGRMGWVSN